MAFRWLIKPVRYRQHYYHCNVKYIFFLIFRKRKIVILDICKVSYWDQTWLLFYKMNCTKRLNRIGKIHLRMNSFELIIQDFFQLMWVWKFSWTIILLFNLLVNWPVYKSDTHGTWHDRQEKKMKSHLWLI